MKLAIFIFRRIILSVLVIIGLSILIFVIARIVPGDPARMALGANAPDWAVENLRQKMNLDKPIYTQYFLWLNGILHGDFGESLYTKRPVIDDLNEFLPASAELVLFSGIIMAAGGIFLGILSTYFNNTWVDNIIRLIAYLGVVTPSFVFAILFILLFSSLWPILPAMGRLSDGVVAPAKITGMISIDSLLQLNFPVFFDSIKHLILPGLALALGGLSQEARITRASMTDNLSKDYILSQRLYGTKESKILFKFLLKPSLIPTISILGLDFATLFGNAFLVEMVFNWPGLSRYGINAMLQKDLNAISAVIIVLGLIFVIVNILADLIIFFLDPRIRFGTGSGRD